MDRKRARENKREGERGRLRERRGGVGTEAESVCKMLGMKGRER